MPKPATRLERKSFFAFTWVLLMRNRLQKRLGVEGGIVAQNFIYLLTSTHSTLE